MECNASDESMESNVSYAIRSSKFRSSGGIRIRTLARPSKRHFIKFRTRGGIGTQTLVWECNKCEPRGGI
eukprot:12375587-Karenia_brevis.AAC.1